MSVLICITPQGWLTRGMCCRQAVLSTHPIPQTEGVALNFDHSFNIATVSLGVQQQEQLYCDKQ